MITHAHVENLVLEQFDASFIGYLPTQKGYKCYHHVSGCTFVIRDVIFWGPNPYHSSGSSCSIQGEINNNEESPAVESSPPVRPIEVSSPPVRHIEVSSPPVILIEGSHPLFIFLFRMSHHGEYDPYMRLYEI